MLRYLPLVLVVLLLATSPLHSQDRPAKTFSDTASVVVIEVPVNVVDDGEPIRGLKAENFRVFDGKKEQKLLGFEVIDLEVAKHDRPAAVPTPARRRFLLFFDLAFTPRIEVARSIAGGRELLAGLHPSDVVAIAAYTRSRGASLLLNFSSDRQQAGALLDGLEDLLDGDAPRVSQSPGGDPLKLVVDQGLAISLDVTSNDIAGEELQDLPSGGRGGTGVASSVRADILDSNSRLNIRGNTERARSYFRGFTEALSQFAKATAGLDGRRFFVLFSSGFDDQIFATSQERNRPMVMGASSAHTFMKRAIEDFRQTGWEIHSVDPGRNQGFSSAVSDVSTGGFVAPPSGGPPVAAFDNLVTFARETGGELYRNFGDLGAAMGEVLDRSSVTYMLAFQVENVRNDGVFHPIQVELVGVPGRPRIHHRQGFVAGSPERAGVSKVVSLAERILSDEEQGGLPLRTLMVPLRGDGNLTRLAVLLETSGQALLEGHTGDELDIEAYAYAIDAKGDIQDFLAQQLTLTTSKVGSELGQRGFEFYSDLALPPGNYRLRVLLRHGQTGREVLKTLPFEVKAVAAEQPRLAALLMPSEAGNEPILIREKAGAGAVPYPFVVGEGQEFFPLIEPTLVELKKRKLVLFGYGLRSGDSGLELRLENAAGEVIEGRLKLVSAAPTEPDGLDRVYLTFDPQGLAPGDYRIFASLRDAAGQLQGQTQLRVVLADS